MREANTQSGFYASAVTTAVLLAGAMGYRAKFQAPPDDAEPYHRRVHQAADALPLRIGPWFGTEMKMTSGAVEILNPNVAVSRVYRNVQNGQSVSLLLVQCPDTRDILGHYPPVCYVVHGWTMLTDPPVAREIPAAGRTLHASEYEFSRMRLDQTAHINVLDVMLLPDGRSCSDMETLERDARDYRVRFFGAAQIQIECDAGMDAEKRQGIYETFLDACKPVIDEIVSGLKS
jgi:hypothetical protein